MPPEGFEPTTLRLKVVYSAQLSYGGKKESIFKVREERADPFPHPLTIAPNGLAVKPGNRRFEGGKPPDDHGRVRTCDLKFRKLLLCPTELRDQSLNQYSAGEARRKGRFTAHKKGSLLGTPGDSFFGKLQGPSKPKAA